MSHPSCMDCCLLIDRPTVLCKIVGVYQVCVLFLSSMIAALVFPCIEVLTCFDAYSRLGTIIGKPAREAWSRLP